MSVALSRPAASAARPAAVRPIRNFLEDIRVDFGPVETLGRLFLKADRELHDMGLRLSFTPVETLVELNQQNRATWRPLVPFLDARVGGINDSNAFALVARNKAGELVASQTCRLYTFTEGSLTDACADGTFFYPDPARQMKPDESYEMTAPAAAGMVGRVTFSGGVWFRPDFRGIGLTSILGRVAKAYAFTRWYTDVTMTFMADSVFANGTWKRAGFPHHEWELFMRNSPMGTVRMALLWIDGKELLPYFESYLAKPHAQVDAVVDKRTA